MAYQVLARKWRPRSLDDMVGQAHVVRALANALDGDRLHHAYLFTGTRGVGKTTLGRILAKAFNCERGVSAHPCGICPACEAIDAGSFVDLLEVDAASRTKVDQTRELLDNVPFAPVQGRYKVYLIDEVHMFSGHSFNALLKTLEEPPPHVKFLLATTDPQKLPVTVLSRCIQFNLKPLGTGEIAGHLAKVLRAEGIAFEDDGLLRLARAAAGSMRDALSLLDQAIAFGGGRVSGEDVRAMLGAASGEATFALLEALAALDAPAVLDEIARVDAFAPDFAGVLTDLLRALHRIALYQQVPRSLAEDDPDGEAIRALASRLSPEDVQLYYQIGVVGQNDCALAPDPRTGIEMVLLRMLAFRPSDQADAPTRPRPASTPSALGSAGEEPPTAASMPVQQGAQPPTSAARPPEAPSQPAESMSPSAALAAARLATGSTGATEKKPERRSPPVRVERDTPSAVVEPGLVLDTNEDWLRFIGRVDLGGVASQLAANCSLVAWDGHHLQLLLDPTCRQMLVLNSKDRLRDLLSQALGRDISIAIEIGDRALDTAARRAAQSDAERTAQAEALLDADPLARSLAERFAGRWVPGTVEADGGGTVRAD